MVRNRIALRFAAALVAGSLSAKTLGVGESRKLEEITVTAQKIEQSLQDVPISISVVSAENLAEIAIFDFTETAQLTPGISLFPGLQAGAIRLRGVGPAFFAVNAPQSVTIFVDEVAQSAVGAVFSTLVDIERIELLRGPQGTLYGQNAPGGAYNISTRRPVTNQLEGYIEGSYSLYDDPDLDRSDVRGAINIPLKDDALALRLAGVTTRSDGYVDVDNPDADDNATGGQDQDSLRARLLWEISPQMDLLWTNNYQDITNYAPGFNYDGIVPGTGGSNATPAVQNEFEDRKSFGSFRSEVEGELVDTSLHWLWRNDLFDVNLLGLYQDFDTQSDENREPFPGGQSNFLLGVDYELNTLELRVSNTGDTLDYLAGVYYLKRDSSSDTDLTLGDIQVLGQASGEDETSSIYANITWHLAPQWDLATGARYDKNTTSLSSDLAFLDFAADVDDSLDFDHLSWSIKLKHYVNENLTAYLAIDNAYKQGGFNPLPAGALALEQLFPDIVGLARENLTYDEETSTAFEIGAKGIALDNRLEFGIAIFYQEFDDHQVGQPEGTVALEPLSPLFNAAITNAAEVVTKGVEFNTTYLLGEYWDINVRAAYFDATIEDWERRLCALGEEDSQDQVFCPRGNGDALNDLPQWNTNAQLGYGRPVTNQWAAYARANWTWNSRANFTTLTDEFNEHKHYLGFTLGFRHAEIGLDVRFWGKNLTDTDANNNPTLTQANGDPALPDAFRGEFNPGREYGLTLSYAF